MKNRIIGVFGKWYDQVYVDNKRLDPRPSQKLWNHSPDGFAWGYGGSGPAQLALAILLEVTGDRNLSLWHHNAFKFAFITGLPDRRDFTLEVDVLEWVSKQPTQPARDHLP